MTAKAALGALLVPFGARPCTLRAGITLAADISHCPAVGSVRVPVAGSDRDVDAGPVRRPEAGPVDVAPPGAPHAVRPTRRRIATARPSGAFTVPMKREPTPGVMRPLTKPKPSERPRPRAGRDHVVGTRAPLGSASRRLRRRMTR